MILHPARSDGGRFHPKRSRYAVQRFAFTLIELVVAVTLGAMLLVALIGVLKSVDNQLDDVRVHAQRDWQTAVVRILQRDLLLASDISTSEGWIWLRGTFPHYGSSTASIREVGYGCAVGIGDGETVLLRWADGRGEPLVFGPRQIVVERLDSMGIPQPLSSRPTSIPARVRIWIWQKDDGDPSFVRDMVLH